MNVLLQLLSINRSTWSRTCASVIRNCNRSRKASVAGYRWSVLSLDAPVAVVVGFGGCCACCVVDGVCCVVWGLFVTPVKQGNEESFKIIIIIIILLVSPNLLFFFQNDEILPFSMISISGRKDSALLRNARKAILTNALNSRNFSDPIPSRISKYS